MPSAQALLPYLDDYWRDQIVNRHIDRNSFNLTSYPPNSPLSARPDWRHDVRAARRRPRHDPPPGARSVRHPLRHLQRAARRDRAVQRGHGGGAVLGGERLDREGTARPRAAAARLDPGAGAQPGARGRGDRAGRAGSALRAGAAVRHGRDAARRPHLLADLRGGREARARHRHPRRQHLSARADGVGLAVLPGRGLRRAIGGLRNAAAELPRRGRVPEISRAASWC